ncbi:MAG: hypothetical protein WD059_05775 [Balneolaceae bacterium]
MSNFDIVILTDSRYINPESPNSYVQNILIEDAIVQKALEGKDLIVTRKDWADPDFNWASTCAVLFRTTWDYFNKVNVFKKWLKNVSSKTLLINSAGIIWWNMDKKYLGELKQRGVPIIPTHYIEKGSSSTLADIHSKTGWKETVLKPTIGGSGRHTFRLKREELKAHEEDFKKLIAEEDFMLQPFQKSIPEKGEWSFIIFGKTFSHAVQKKAKQGDFRVQDDFGGTVHNYQPKQKEINFAMRAVAACPANPAYARVDVVMDNEGELAVSELELIEPELWFRRKPEAAELMAEEVLKHL